MSFQGEQYLNAHIVRLYRTFQECSRILSTAHSKNVLSAGAGSAYVEARLRRLQAQVTIIDFEESIELNQEHYSRYGFRCYPADLSTRFELDIQHAFDVILSCEVVEHLPIAPSDHIGSLVRYLAPGGHFMLTTPNLACLRSIAKLFLGQPLAPEPKLTLAPVGFETERIHRREYVESEIVSAMIENSLRHLKTCYFRNSRGFNLRRLALFPLETIKPSFRPTMLVIGHKSG
jgi:2-polyprenyl-3-methyl-5-hydroxy-6-metoxy-1,4-benzoquinol methylase